MCAAMMTRVQRKINHLERIRRLLFRCAPCSPLHAMIKWTLLTLCLSIWTQRYVLDPLLVEGYKFDIRCYLLVARNDPTYLAFYHPGYCRYIFLIIYSYIVPFQLKYLNISSFLWWNNRKVYALSVLIWRGNYWGSTGSLNQCSHSEEASEVIKYTIYIFIFK